MAQALKSVCCEYNSVTIKMRSVRNYGWYDTNKAQELLNCTKMQTARDWVNHEIGHGLIPWC